MDPWRTEELLDEELNRPIRDLVEIEPYRKAEDEKGHGITLGARVPRSMEREVIRLTELPGSPYDIKSDAVRDALYVGLKILTLRYKLPDWQVKVAMARVSSTTDEASRIRESVEEFVESLGKLSRERDGKDKAKEFLNQYINHVESLQDSWTKARYRDALNEYGIVRELLNAST